jgi:hypothetical protein
MVDWPVEIADGLTAALRPTDDNRIKVTIRETAGDNDRVVYSADHARDFFTSKQKVGEIGNELKGGVVEVDPDVAKGGFKELCNRFSAKQEELKKELRPPVVEQVLEETERVEVFGGDPATVTVTLQRDGETRRIEFTSGEFTGKSPAKLRSRYYNCFYERLDLGEDEWGEITEAWEEQQVISGREEATGWQAVADRIANGLRAEIKPVADKEALANGTYTAWYAPGSDGEGETAADGGGTVWVQGDALTEKLEETSKSVDDLSALSKTLKAEGYTFSGSKQRHVNGNRTRLYPFDPDALGIERGDVFDEDSGEEVEP